MLDFTLTKEQKALRKKARRFALKEILSVVHYFDHEDKMPVYILKKAHEEGLMNLGIPKKYGGKERSLLDHALVVEEIAAACVGMATSLFDNSLGIEPIILCDNNELKEQILPEIVNNFKLVSFATSEPVMGSDVAGITCKAVKDNDEWVLNGTKYWVTNGGYADYYSIFATTDPQKRHQGICAFLVEKDRDGVSVTDSIPKLGLRTSNTAGVTLDSVRVPEENVLAPPGLGFILAMQTFSRTRPIIGAFATGAARSAMEYALEYVNKRRAFNKKLKEFEGIQVKIAEMYQKVETSRLLTWKAAWEADQGKDPTISASIAKFYGSEAAIEVVNMALQILGGYGYTNFYPLEKLYRDVRVLTIYEGTSEIQRILLSRLILDEYEAVMPSLQDMPRLKAEDPEKAAREGMKLQKVWRCRMCGYYHYGETPPDNCPYCQFPKSAFNQVWPQPE
jgi:acyl-CoA dehydrogenase